MALAGLVMAWQVVSLVCAAERGLLGVVEKARVQAKLVKLS